MKHSLILIRIIAFYKIKLIAGKDVEKLMQNMKTIWQSLIKLKIKLPHDQIIPFLCTYTKKMEVKVLDVLKPMFRVTLFKIV